MTRNPWTRRATARALMARRGRARRHILVVTPDSGGEAVPASAWAEIYEGLLSRSIASRLPRIPELLTVHQSAVDSASVQVPLDDDGASYASDRLSCTAALLTLEEHGCVASAERLEELTLDAITGSGGWLSAWQVRDVISRMLAAGQNGRASAPLTLTERGISTGAAAERLIRLGLSSDPARRFDTRAAGPRPAA